MINLITSGTKKLQRKCVEVWSIFWQRFSNKSLVHWLGIIDCLNSLLTTLTDNFVCDGYIYAPFNDIQVMYSFKFITMFFFLWSFQVPPFLVQKIFTPTFWGNFLDGDWDVLNLEQNLCLFILLIFPKHMTFSLLLSRECCTLSYGE
ncbi:hypothetical protein ABFX02_04G200000 [Erythranthe guttata]